MTRGYLRLCDPQLGERFFPLLADAYARARAAPWRRPSSRRCWRATRCWRARSICAIPTSIRSASCRIELLARYRAAPADAPDRPRLERALMMSILGIAAGLRNAG